jgi:uncharacterized membrane protein
MTVGTPLQPPRQSRHRKSGWLIPTGLLTISFIPLVAGAMRVFQLAAAPAITPENARFAVAPFPVVLHILSALIFCVLGAFQFLPSLRRRKPHWHRMSGQLVVTSGLLVAFSGLWMTLYYPAGVESLAKFDGPALYVIRLMAGSTMALLLCLGIAAILRRDIPQHRAWMMRGYAVGLGAGTQAFTHLPWFIFPGIQGELARTLCMAAGWVINLAVAEWIIARENDGQVA